MTDTTKAPEALPCPDPECGGGVTLLAGGAMGAHCEKCERRWSTRSYAQSLSQVQEELEEARGLVETVRREAAMHAMESRTQRGTVHRILQIVSRAKGEAAPWNAEGAVASRIADLERQLASSQEELAEARERAGLPTPVAIQGTWQSKVPPGLIDLKVLRLDGTLELTRHHSRGSGIPPVVLCQGTLAECLTALRTELASQDEENGDE